jgi:two-component system repressor protein LuxO
MSPTPSRVLVVEDEADMATSYERLLRRQGYRVEAVGSRAGGLLALERDPPGLVISDLRLPDGDGLDIVRAARRRVEPTPVIIVTGFASEAARQTALAAGATAFLVKPFTAAALLGLVRELLGPPPRGAERI